MYVPVGWKQYARNGKARGIIFQGQKCETVFELRLQLRQFFLSSEQDCEAIEVTADPSNNHVGIYLLTDKKISDNPVWKIQLGDRFIFNTGRYSTSGWRIGSKSSLTSGSYYCHGKHTIVMVIIF